MVSLPAEHFGSACATISKNNEKCGVGASKTTLGPTKIEPRTSPDAQNTTQERQERQQDVKRAAKKAQVRKILPTKPQLDEHVYEDL